MEFQLPRQWAPVFGDVPLGPDRKHQGAASLQFSLMGPKLYVNTDEVETKILSCLCEPDLVVIYDICHSKTDLSDTFCVFTLYSLGPACYFKQLLFLLSNPVLIKMLLFNTQQTRSKILKLLSHSLPYYKRN